VNERDQIAGVSYTSSVPSPVPTQCGENIPPQNPFLWEKGRMINLGTLGGICSFTSGLNNKGQVVGQSDLAGDTTTHPFIWDREKRPRLRDLGTLGGTFGFATSLNDSGQVAGAATTKTDQALHAFLWEKGRMADLGTVKGDGCSVAYRVNANGQVVGASGDGCHEVRAFLWQQGGPMMDLNDLITHRSRLVLTAGEFINDRGEIGASGVLPNGDHHAILLVPCDDATWKDECGQNDFNTEDAAAALPRTSPVPPRLSRSSLLAQSRARVLRQRRHLGPTVPMSK
jgi:probable HAF family extracellular repeat protein